MTTDSTTLDRIINLPEYRATHHVTGVERRRNVHNGPLLTLAIAEWHREGFTNWHPETDIVTRMRLADAVSDQHDFPVNADRLYGPRGRRGPVGRIAESEATDGR